MEGKEEKYEVIESFRDLKDEEHIYLKDVEGKNIYPREGLKTNKKRIEELLTNKNKIGKPLIRKLKEKTELKEEISENRQENELEE